ncbi:MAG: ATP-dependent helicase [Blautia sp.]|nr:ATP-dependent helicase [Blautia sp.]MCM1200611.1 ATP-dependent helicase [Bacteroides fragilis]
MPEFTISSRQQKVTAGSRQQKAKGFTTSPSQQRAVTYTAGPMQVLAGPGSGKTFTITQRIRYLIQECGVEPSRILVITFTKAAADEMQRRFHKLVKGKNSFVAFGTFHAVFYSILKQTRQYRQFTLITETQKRGLLAQILQLPMTPLLAENEKINGALRLIGQVKNNGGRFDGLPEGLFAKEELKEIYEDYNGYLVEFHKMDFDDMGLLCLKLFRENPNVLKEWQGRYSHILVDEFQDINPLQYQVVRMLAQPENNLFIVGDDDQSIYGFRGARPDIMRQFLADYPAAEQVLLDVNYRCHAQIVEKSLQVIAANGNRFPKSIRAEHEKGEGVVMRSFPGQEKEYEELLRMLQETVRTRPDALSETAVIYRTNYECGILAEKLLLQEIPFVMKETLKSRYDHFVVKDLLAYLEFANGNRKREIFHLFMNRPLRYLRKDCARGGEIFLKELLAYYQNDIRMQQVARELFHDLEQLGRMRPYLAVRYIRQVIGYDDYLKETYSVEESRKLLQIADDFQKEIKRFAGFTEMDDYISQCRALAQEKQEEIENSVYDRPRPGIRLMTMHAAKGLEFSTVYLPDVNEGKLPSRQAVAPDEIEEERRMFYVAMTRAKKTLYLFYCEQENGKDRPSRFLDPILPVK